MQIKELGKTLNNGLYSTCICFGKAFLSSDFTFVTNPHIFHNRLLNNSDVFIVEAYDELLTIFNIKLKSNLKTYHQIILQYNCMCKENPLVLMQIVESECDDNSVEKIKMTRYYNDTNRRTSESPDIKFSNKIKKLLLSLEKRILQDGLSKFEGNE